MIFHKDNHFDTENKAERQGRDVVILFTIPGQGLAICCYFVIMKFPDYLISLISLNKGCSYG